MSIKEIALQKEVEYNAKYIQWCKDNPCHIMNGLSSKAMGAKFASYCDTEEDLKTLIKVYKRKAEDMKGPHGFYFIAAAIEEILEELKSKN